MSKRIVSPCVGLCSTTVGDTVCRGCQRNDIEIRDWFRYDDDERRAAMQRLDAWRETAAGRYLRVTDADQLQAQLERHRIRFRHDQPSLSRAVELLRVGRDRIRDIRRYGLEPRGQGNGLAADELHEAISRTLMAQARAHRQSLDTDPSTT
ncbi:MULTISPECIES: DUF1289 domain-containing protein [Modicisalibacter]|uniref:DUF1289 domain-containing protein n=1 Tax=Modicisalibacter TaxID=574347 RepID=UPI00100AE007|nr:MULTISPECIES: DUF1289 domain-containing protein [Halomonadaceae]MBZ9557024.1 DUF1289 domain-containing protein [Modicisalibacter sp. R2A 31.J]MBZ9574262.1 DUF1289 domain-containing protein [Modicisalibacter sp. MOD 31.J]